MDLQRLKAGDPVNDISAALLADGAVLVDGLLDADLLTRFNAELDPLLAAARPDHGRYVNDTIADFFGTRTRHVLGMGGKSRVFATEILPHPVYLGSTIHAGGSNTTEGWRRGMHLSYGLGWLRTEENQFLATPLEVARTLPRQSQELLGYAAHDAIATGGGYLGTVEVQDPVELIASGEL